MVLQYIRELRLSFEDPDFLDVVEGFREDNYRVILLAAEETKLKHRKKRLERKLKLPKYPEVELTLVLESSTNPEKQISGPLYFLELHPYRILLATLDNCTLTLNEHGGYHYATLLPKDAIDQKRREYTIYPDRPYLCTGGSSTPFVTNFMQEKEFHTLVSRLNMTIDDINTPESDYWPLMQSYVNQTGAIYDAVMRLFAPDQIDAYEKVDRTTVSPEHKDMPLFKISNLRKPGVLDRPDPSIPSMLATCAFGTDKAVRQNVPNFYQMLFYAIELSAITILFSLASASHPEYAYISIPAIADFFVRMSRFGVSQGRDYAGIIGTAYQTVKKLQDRRNYRKGN